MPRETARTQKVNLPSLSPGDLRKHFDTVARRAAKRILAQYPHALAVAVDGSVGRGRPLPFSDIDIYVIMPPGKRPSPIYYFDDGCYVGIGFNVFHKDTSPKGIDFFWARGGSLTTRILYDPKGILKRHIKSVEDPDLPEVLWRPFSWTLIPTS